MRMMGTNFVGKTQVLAAADISSGRAWCTGMAPRPTPR